MHLKETMWGHCETHVLLVEATEATCEVLKNFYFLKVILGRHKTFREVTGPAFPPPTNHIFLGRRAGLLGNSGRNPVSAPAFEQTPPPPPPPPPATRHGSSAWIWGDFRLGKSGAATQPCAVTMARRGEGKNIYF